MMSLSTYFTTKKWGSAVQLPFSAYLPILTFSYIGCILENIVSMSVVKVVQLVVKTDSYFLQFRTLSILLKDEWCILCDKQYTQPPTIYKSANFQNIRSFKVAFY